MATNEADSRVLKDLHGLRGGGSEVDSACKAFDSSAMVHQVGKQDTELSIQGESPTFSSLVVGSSAASGAEEQSLAIQSPFCGRLL